MKPSPRDLKKLRKRTGFSLIIVLIISLVGFAIIGVTLQFTMSAGGSGRVANASGARYNLLQAAAEEGRAKLKEKIDSKDPKDPVPRYAGADMNNVEIDALNDLLVNIDFGVVPPTFGVAKKEKISHADLGRLGIMNTAGSEGELTVSIYDMQYEPDAIAVSSMSSADLRMLPPSIRLGSASAQEDSTTTLLADQVNRVAATEEGMYLIRAELLVGGRSTILDVAVLQANNE